jgi:GNAT superfamily N-acetyltransferase
MIDYSQIKVTKLTEDTVHLTKDFDCDDKELNEFIKEDALDYQSGKIAVTYIMLYSGRPVGYFCLSNDAVELRGKQKKELAKLGKAQKTYPAMKIGRLGVVKTNQRMGIGSFMVKQALGIALLQSRRAGCRFMTVDAYNKEAPLNLYQKNGFQKLIIKEENEGIPMYMDLKKYSILKA